MSAHPVQKHRRARNRLLSIAMATALAVTVTGRAAMAEEDVVPEAPTYSNPVMTGVTENFADPTIIRGRDGYWYAYATNGPRFPGDDRQLMMITRSTDLIDWEWVGPVFTPETMPTYDGRPAEANRQFWAPEIAYVDGQYVLYYSYVVNDPREPWRVVAAATADHPAGPWTDTGEVVVGNETWEVRPGVTEVRNNIDPDLLTARDGTRYLYYGSVQGGVRVVKLTEDGLRAEGDPVQLTDAHRYEAPYVVYREGYYYLMMSVIGGCCAGAASGYPVMVGRSEDPMGPFLDRDGHSLDGPTGGGTPVLSPNGNKWVSTGHNAVATDLSGQDWIVSHAIDRTKPYVQERENARHLVLTRLDWIDGWPVGNAGKGIADGPEPGPRTQAVLADAFEGDLSAWDVPEGWEGRTEAAGGYVHTTGEERLVSHVELGADSRLRAAVRLEAGNGGRAGLIIGAAGPHGVSAWIDRDERKLLVTGGKGRHQVHAAAPLPAGFGYDTWHEIEIEVTGGRMHVAVTESGQYDPVAEVETPLHSGLAGGPIALAAEGTGADFDDVTAAPYRVVDAETAPVPEIGSLDPALSTDFAEGIGPEWSWTGAPAATVDGGDLNFEVPSSTLINRRPPADHDVPSLLLRDIPEGAWTAETTVTIPFADTIPYGWPQAGLIAHVDDDEWAALAYTTRESRRFTAFARETPNPDGVGVAYGHAALGPSRDTMHLRLHHTVADNGEHRYRAALSLDGEHWQWHGTRTLPAGEQPRIGLFAMDYAAVNEEPLTATFDGFRVYR